LVIEIGGAIPPLRFKLTPQKNGVETMKYLVKTPGNQLDYIVFTDCQNLNIPSLLDECGIPYQSVSEVESTIDFYPYNPIYLDLIKGGLTGQYCELNPFNY